jgi:hypothetical protein
MIKKAIVIIALQFLLLTNIVSVAAKPVEVTTAVSVIGDLPSAVGEIPIALSFAQLGLDDAELVSPFGIARLIFSTPPNWQLMAGGDIQIDYNLLLSGAGLAQMDDSANPYGGSLSVTFNDYLIGTIPLGNVGSNTVRFQLPPEALLPTLEGGRHFLRIALDAGFSCQNSIRAVVTIKNTSMLNLVYETSSPKLDLSQLPAPFYLDNAFIPEKNLVITPEDPTAAQLQSALNVMAGFGSMVGTTADFELVNVGALSNDDLASSNLIFVGPPDKLLLLSNIDFPLAVTDGRFANIPSDSVSDGVVQMAVSPWNTGKVVLLVSGQTDTAIAKASQAISSGRVLTYQDPRFAYVKDVQLLADSIPVIEDFSLQNLGYQTEEINGVGTSSVDYAFLVAKPQVTTKEAYIDLQYYHSGLLEDSLSSMNIDLNGQIINSTALDKESEQLTTLRIKFPAGLMRYGENHLTISANLLADTSCDTTGFSNPWVIISDQSTFHLPISTSESFSQLSLMDLKNYPAPFLTHSDLGDVAFVLPRSSPASWGIAGKMAYALGDTANPIISGLKVVYADDVSPEVRANNSLIIIGRASTLPLLTEINDSLPAPFDVTNDTASERQLQVVYRIPEGVSVGYLELLNSPFNIDRAILVMSGNDDNGLILAGNAMLVSDLRNQVSGLFAVTNGVQVAVGNNDSLFSVVGDAIPEAQVVVTTPISPNAVTANPYERPGWLVPLLIISSLTILILIAFVIRSAISAGNSSGNVEIVRSEEEDPSLKG